MAQVLGSVSYASEKINFNVSNMYLVVVFLVLIEGQLMHKKRCPKPEQYQDCGN